MATNTMDNDAPSATGETKDSDLASENASLRERLMRALAESENTRRQGERRGEDAQQTAITNFARELWQVRRQCAACRRSRRDRRGTEKGRRIDRGSCRHRPHSDSDSESLRRRGTERPQRAVRSHET